MEIKDKNQEIFLDATPVNADVFFFKSIDIIEEVEDPDGRTLVIASCNDQKEDNNFSLN